MNVTNVVMVRTNLFATFANFFRNFTNFGHLIGKGHEFMAFLMAIALKHGNLFPVLRVHSRLFGSKDYCNKTFQTVKDKAVGMYCQTAQL